MSLRTILTMPDARLRQVCATVEAFEADLAALAEDMMDTMYAAPGRGLAAPQIGVMRRVFVMDADWKEGMSAPLVCVNPVLLASSSTKAVFAEGCLSIPDHTARIARPALVRLAWQDLTGRACEGDFDGVGAVIVQHERDHLDGILCTDYPDISLVEATV